MENNTLIFHKVFLPTVPYNRNLSSDYCWCITDINEKDYNFQNYVYKSSSYCTSQGDTVMLSHLFYVKLKRAEDIGLLESLADSMEVSIVGHDIFMPLWYTLSCNQHSVGNALQAANLFYESGLFAAAGPDFLGSVKMDCVNDTYASSQWGLNNTGQDGGSAGVDIRYCQAREISQGSSDIIVAIVDKGFEKNHPDLANVCPLSYDARFGTQPSHVYGYHGTACAGIVGATPNNNLGVAGIAPLSPIMDISGDPDNGLYIIGQYANGINFAWHNGASVISNSWHCPTPIDMLDEAIDSALHFGRGGKGCVLVFASGNESYSTVSYPASSDGVLSVGAIDRCGSRAGRADSVPSSCDPWTGIWPGSNYGNKLSLVAPGTNIYTIDNQGQAGYNTMPSPAGDYCSDFGGTSAATPHVAGVAALVLSVNPCLTYEEVIEILESTCTKIRPDLYTYGSNPDHPNGTWNNEVGYGLVNAYEALLLAQSYLLPDTITTTATWNEKKRIYADLIIDSLATLTITDTLYVAGGSRIIVRPGGKLIVNGGTLTNACDGEMWQGIIVEGNANIRQAALAQGSVILNNATIENARDAICTRKAGSDPYIEHAGGIIQATNTLFRNNRRSVEFLRYENHTTG
ncbi:MAG: S8 family serine peptidase, partial [Bacteroidales bacterium]|nr:S8 family serine peptidase [Bacteroidales bacterium]